MSIKSYLAAVILITICSLLHVHQQVTMIGMSYSIKESERDLNHLLDRNAFLQYNVAVLKSPASLTERLPKAEYAFRTAERIVVARAPEGGIDGLDVGIAEQDNGFLANLRNALDVRTEAHATER